MEPRTWLDLTIRPAVEPEIDIQPDNTIELTWPLPDGGRITFLMEPEHVRKVNEKVRTLLLMVES